ncbi:FAD-linked oxidase [Cellulomonas sp. Leaf334]|nr:FAD-linked oxidase [Cellulomonas sp. Leaf334]
MTDADLRTLSALADGRVLRPGDDGWAGAVAVWNGMVSTRPAVVAQPSTSQQVAALVGFARTHRLLLAIKGGGHHIAGTSIAAGGLVLDMSRMDEVTVDPVARTAVVGPGCLLRDVDAATQEHGLAAVLGFVSGVGVAGLTLGGGLGYLTRRFGWAVDNLLEVEIVTADGQVRRAAADENPDLFWAVRGAGANLGVVTRLTVRLHEVGPLVHGGLVAWPFERADEILRAYRALTSEAPRELAVWLMLIHAPPEPFVPPSWHGRKVCAMAVCYTGSAPDEALAPIRALRDPVVDLVGPVPYTGVQSYLDDSEPAGMHYYWKTSYHATLSDELLDVSRELFAQCEIPGAELGFLHLGGALNERAWDDGAVGNRDARYVSGANGMWAPDEPRAHEFRRWVSDAGRRIEALGTGRSYVNFQTADEGEDRVLDSYGPNADRLQRIKEAYDPGNLFRCNRNIRPRTHG